MLKKKSKKILSVFFINFLLTLLVVLVAELIFGNWIFGPKYSVLNTFETLDKLSLDSFYWRKTIEDILSKLKEKNIHL